MAELLESYLATIALKAGTEKPRKIAAIRTTIAATGSRELVIAFARLECSSGQKASEAFIQVIQAMRGQARLPKVDSKYVRILVKVKRAEGTRPELCAKVFENSS